MSRVEATRAALAGALLCAGLGLGACKGPPVGAYLGGTGGTGAGAGGRGDAGAGTGTGGRQDAGTGTGGAGVDAGPPLTPLTIVPGTGVPGTAYLNMMAFDAGTAYFATFDLTEGDPGSFTVLTPNVIVKAIPLAGGAARRLSAAGEAAELLLGDLAPIAVDDTYAYWFSRTRDDTSELNRLRRAPKAGGGPEEDVAAIAPGPTTTSVTATVIVADGASVYWASDGSGIFRCPSAAGCPGGPQVVVDTSDEILGMVVRGDALFWNSVTSGKVWRHGLTSGADDVLDAGPSTGVAQACGLAVDGNDLYWIQCLWPYEVRHVRLDPLSVESIGNATGETVDQSAAGSLAVAPDAIYFMGSDHLFTIPRTGGSAVRPVAELTVAGTTVRAQVILGIDAAFVYLQGSDRDKTNYVLRLAR
jgi:hypothetical protein